MTTPQVSLMHKLKTYFRKCASCRYAVHYKRHTTDIYVGNLIYILVPTDLYARVYLLDSRSKTRRKKDDIYKENCIKLQMSSEKAILSKSSNHVIRSADALPARPHISR